MSMYGTVYEFRKANTSKVGFTCSNKYNIVYENKSNIYVKVNGTDDVIQFKKSSPCVMSYDTFVNTEDPFNNQFYVYVTSYHKEFKELEPDGKVILNTKINEYKKEISAIDTKILRELHFIETSEKSIKDSKQRIVELDKKLKEFSDKVLELQVQKEKISKDKSLKKCPYCENGVMSYNSYFDSYICDTCKRTES